MRKCVTNPVHSPKQKIHRLTQFNGFGIDYDILVERPELCDCYCCPSSTADFDGAVLAVF